VGEDGYLAEAGRGVGVDWVDSLENIDQQHYDCTRMSENALRAVDVGFPYKRFVRHDCRRANITISICQPLYFSPRVWFDPCCHVATAERRRGL
jgi:hypothetical protein